MILIADSGSTKTHWELVNLSNGQHAGFVTDGINPFYLSTDEISSKVESQVLPKLKDKAVQEVHFYGAGCSQQDKYRSVTKAIKQHFKTQRIKVEHDLLAAARATCGRSPGITAILGTGSNSCLYDGKEIIDNIPSLGFLLGDEGSAGDMGRQLLKAYYYRELPSDLMAVLENTFKMDKAHVLNQIYDATMPNQVVAGYARFLSENNDHPFVIELIETAFVNFLERFIRKYEGCEKLPIHFIGSMAYFNQAIMRRVIKRKGLLFGAVLKSPMEGLIKYHLNEI